MNNTIISGMYGSGDGTYRTKDGKDYFKFKVVPRRQHFDIYCVAHPPLNGRDSDVNKTHLWQSKLICFVKGKEPRSPHEAIRRAADWAEYFQAYIRTGVHQS